VVRLQRGFCDAELLDRLYEAPFEPKGWADFLRALERSAEGAVGMLCMPAPSPGCPGVVIAPSIEAELVEAYRTRYHRLDPWLRDAKQVPVGEVVTHSTAADDCRPEPTLLHLRWLRPLGVRRGYLGSLLERDERGRCSLLNLFPKDGSEPRREWADLLTELVPHLRRALRVQAETRQLRAERRALNTAVDRLALGVVVVDRDHRVHFTNRKGDSLLARRDGLILDREGLHAARPEDDCRMRHALAHVCDVEARSGATLAFSIHRRAERSPLRARVWSVPSSGDPETSSGLAVLFVSDPDDEVELPSDALKQLYDLTNAESALVRELANGRAVQEAATRLTITEGTTRQRLATVFDKTRTGRQASLVRLVLTGPESLRTEE